MIKQIKKGRIVAAQLTLQLYNNECGGVYSK